MRGHGSSGKSFSTPKFLEPKKSVVKHHYGSLSKADVSNSRSYETLVGTPGVKSRFRTS